VIVQPLAIFEYTKGCPKILLVDHDFHPKFHGLSSDSSMYHWLMITGYLGSQMTTLDKPTVATSSHRDPKRTNICKIHGKYGGHIIRNIPGTLLLKEVPTSSA
jgi:hypothetical protein